jgi:hypothetical protein
MERERLEGRAAACPAAASYPQSGSAYESSTHRSPTNMAAGGGGGRGIRPGARGLRSFTSQLSVTQFCGIGMAFFWGVVRRW